MVSLAERNAFFEEYLVSEPGKMVYALIFQTPWYGEVVPIIRTTRLDRI